MTTNISYRPEDPNYDPPADSDVPVGRIDPVHSRRLRDGTPDGRPELHVVGAPTGGLSVVRVEQAHGRGTRSTRVGLVVKYAVDRVGALVALVCLLPLLVLVGLAVCLTSPGPALFRQERVGRDGKTFRIWKFRTMRVGADNELQSLLRQHGRDGSPLFKVPDDPRITWLGKHLRRTSIDELPQLLNVLAGQMSFVGPRPQMLGEVALYRPHERLRLLAKPGLTGLWQVSGRSAVSWAEALELDMSYIRNWSLLLDTRILLKTPAAVIRGRGAE